MDNLDSSFIDEALTEALTEEQSHAPKGKAFFSRYTAIAAGLAVLAVSSLLICPRLSSRTGEQCNTITVNVGGVMRTYLDLNTEFADSEMIYPREYLTLSEQFSAAYISGREYTIGARLKSTEYLGRALGKCEVHGWDPITFEEYSDTFDAFSVDGISEVQLTAVDLGGEYYICRRSEYFPPSDLGLLIDMYRLTENIAFEQFYSRGEAGAGEYFSTGKNDEIWELLLNNGSAKFVDESRLDPNWYPMASENVTFSVTSDPLGIYKNSVSITADGYLWTNIFGWAYVYDLGADAARSIIELTRSDAVRVDPEPYYYTVTGEITDISGDAITVDDSALCADRSEGMSFTISRSDIRAERCIACGVIGAGDMVTVTFSEPIDTENSNTISGVVDIERVRLTNEP